MPLPREERIKELVSREYKIFREEERVASLPRTLYEKACRTAEKTMRVRADKKARAKMQEAIDFAHLKVTPDGIISLTLLFMLLVLIPTVALMATHVLGFIGISFGYGMLAILMGIFFTYYLYSYPMQLKRKYEARVGSEIVTMILYMVMYMRNTPSLEGAVRFAAQNISGELGYEMRKLLWDVEVRNYLSMEEALIDYSKKWRKNRPFTDAVQVIITSLRQSGERRISLLNEAIAAVLEGTREQAKHFNQRLKLPVTVVNALGIILPIMGLVLFPIVAVFLGVESTVLFLGYDVILPLILYFVITGIMEIRPATYSKIDISENPDVPPKGRFKMGKKFVRAWPFAFAAGAAVVGLGIFLYFGELAAAGEAGVEGIIPAVLITAGIAIGFALYFILISNPLLSVRNQTRQIESEFAEALYQLGNQISGGTPIELSIEQSMDRIKNLRIRELFSKALNNMKLLGFTFQQAFFDEQYGAIRYYPSKMIKSVMHTVIESSKKGVKVAANAMLSVSRYLKGLHTTQEEVRGSLNDTLNSLKFQAFFLTPVISGVIGTLAVIIIRVLRDLAVQAETLGGPEGIPLLTQFGTIAITPFEFILIVSIYMLETLYILAMFINSIENGEDPIGRQNMTGYILIIGSVVFIASLLLTLIIFSPLISAVGV